MNFIEVENFSMKEYKDISHLIALTIMNQDHGVVRPFILVMGPECEDQDNYDSLVLPIPPIERRRRIPLWLGMSLKFPHLPETQEPISKYQKIDRFHSLDAYDYWPWFKAGTRKVPCLMYKANPVIYPNGTLAVARIKIGTLHVECGDGYLWTVLPNWGEA